MTFKMPKLGSKWKRVVGGGRVEVITRNKRQASDEVRYVLLDDFKLSDGQVQRAGREGLIVLSAWYLLYEEDVPTGPARMLNDLPEETLIRATGTYPGGGTFTECWARPVPQYVTGAADGSDRLWEVLVFGSGGIDALTTSACITSFEVLYQGDQ